MKRRRRGKQKGRIDGILMWVVDIYIYIYIYRDISGDVPV